MNGLQKSIGRLLLALGAGAALPFAFAPYSHHALAIACLAILFCLWDGAEPKAAALVGLIFGLGMFGHGVWWIQVSVHQFGLPLYSFSVAVTVAFVVFMSTYPALCGYLASVLPAPHRSARVLFLFPAVWIGIEMLRGWLFTGFPWLLVGYSQADSPLSAFAPDSRRLWGRSACGPARGGSARGVAWERALARHCRRDCRWCRCWRASLG